MNRKKIFPTLLSILFIALVWQLISVAIGYPAIFPGLSDLIIQISQLILSKSFLVEVSTTILRGISGFILAFLFAGGIATISRFSDFWKHFFHPLIVITRSIPVISFVLLAIFWFTPSKLPIFIALLTMFPILVQNILTGLEQTDLKWIEMAKVFGKSPIKRFFTIYLPASKANIFDGISTAMGFGWRAIIIGEVLAQPLHGIGTAMKQAQAFINVSELIAWTVIIIFVSYLFDFLIKRIRKIQFRHSFPKTRKDDFILESQPIVEYYIKLINLDKRFNDVIVFHSLNTTFVSDKITCLKGPSGKGKTTLLRLIAGIEKPDSGQLNYFKNHTFGYSFQDVRLLPWLTVYENILFGIHNRNVHKQHELAAFLMRKLELSDQAQKFPHELSGGQQQRVGLARALASESNILLLDEPLNGLDNELKSRIIIFLSEWIKAYKPLVIWATHESIQLTDSEICEMKL